MNGTAHSHPAYARVAGLVALTTAAAACLWVAVGQVAGHGGTESNATGGAVVGALIGLSLAVRVLHSAER